MIQYIILVNFKILDTILIRGFNEMVKMRVTVILTDLEENKYKFSFTSNLVQILIRYVFNVGNTWVDVRKETLGDN